MEYTYELIAELKIIKVNVFGDLLPMQAALMGIMIRTKAYEMGYKLLFDYTLISSVQISMGAAYFWFIDHYDSINIAFRYIPTAYLVNEIIKSDFNFFELTCYNKGIKVRIFMENEKALEWLNHN